MLCFTVRSGLDDREKVLCVWTGRTVCMKCRGICYGFIFVDARGAGRKSATSVGSSCVERPWREMRCSVYVYVHCILVDSRAIASSLYTRTARRESLRWCVPSFSTSLSHAPYIYRMVGMPGRLSSLAPRLASPFVRACYNTLLKPRIVRIARTRTHHRRLPGARR